MYIKVGFKGVYITLTCFRDVIFFSIETYRASRGILVTCILCSLKLAFRCKQELGMPGKSSQTHLAFKSVHLGHSTKPVLGFVPLTKAYKEFVR